MATDLTLTPRSIDLVDVGLARVGLLGCGTVGTEVARALLTDRCADLRLEAVAVAHPEKHRSVDLPLTLVGSDPLAVVEDPDVDIVVELIGGLELPHRLIGRALELGKSVVTANKEVIARNGRELTALATRKGARLYFEGAVGGAIPMVATLADALRGDRITRLQGILNGTTNHVLTSVAQGVEIDVAIESARAAGYAESDPTDDLTGADAARKSVILGSLAFGCRLEESDVLARGIDVLSRGDVAGAQRLGFVTKLVATISEHAGFVHASVEPCALPGEHPLATVDGSSNCLVVNAELSGAHIFMGAGAGGPETASAVLSDLLRARSGAPGPSFPWNPDVRPFRGGEAPGRFVVRCLAADSLEAGLVEGCLFSHGVGVEAVDTHVGGNTFEISVVTGLGERSCIEKALAKLEPRGVFCMSVLRVVER